MSDTTDGMDTQGNPPSPSPWKPGDQLERGYRIEREIAAGVYLVRHLKWNLDLVMKTPRTEKEPRSWVEELGLHPHIVTCYYVRQIEGFPRLFLEYVPGGNLWSLINTSRASCRWQLQQLLDVAIQVAWGLEHAHERGVIHEDVKPENVLLSSDNTAKITDFGGGMTPSYCSPEQVSNERVEPATDIWSWAVTVLAMFGGAVGAARVESSAPEILEEHRARGGDGERFPNMPDDLYDLLRQCFQKSPSHRPTAAQVADRVSAMYAQFVGPYSRRKPRGHFADADCLNNQGLSLIELDEPSKAQTAWRDALEKSPMHPEATFNLWITRWRLGQATDVEVMAELEEATRFHPDQWLLMAHFLLEQDDCEELIARFQRITSDPVLRHLAE